MPSTYRGFPGINGAYYKVCTETMCSDKNPGRFGGAPHVHITHQKFKERTVVGADYSRRFTTFEEALAWAESDEQSVYMPGEPVFRRPFVTKR